MDWTADELLAAAWKKLAPAANTSGGFPRGFWPDVARVAIEMHLQQTLDPVLPFRPTMCSTGNWPEPRVVAGDKPAKRSAAGGADKAQRAANTAALLARLSQKAPDG